MSTYDNRTGTFLMQPPGWAVKEAEENLDLDATDTEVLRLAWEYVDAEEAEEDDS